MSTLATADSHASSARIPALRLVEAASEPHLPWTAGDDGRFEAHAPALDVVLSPVPDGQSVRLLEVNGDFHILTGRIRDDRAMQVLAEDLAAGFAR